MMLGDEQPEMSLTALTAIASVASDAYGGVSKNSKRSMKRSKITHDQVAVLVAFFHRQPLPDHEERLALATQLDMTPRSVQVWFQNRRQRTKPTYAPAAQSKAARALVEVWSRPTAPSSPDDALSTPAPSAALASSSEPPSLALAPPPTAPVPTPTAPAPVSSFAPTSHSLAYQDQLSANYQAFLARQGYDWKAPMLLGAHRLGGAEAGGVLAPPFATERAAYPAAAATAGFVPIVPFTPATSISPPLPEHPPAPPPAVAPPAECGASAPSAPATESLVSPGAMSEGVNALLMLCGTAV